jgi:hypothetical protein
MEMPVPGSGADRATGCSAIMVLMASFTSPAS